MSATESEERTEDQAEEKGADEGNGDERKENVGRVEEVQGVVIGAVFPDKLPEIKDRKSTRLNSSHANISYAVFCLKKKTSARVTGPRMWNGPRTSGRG